MNYPPYSKFPELSSDSIRLKAVELKDIPEFVEISFYDAKQASSIEEAEKMQNRLGLPRWFFYSLVYHR